MSSQRKAHAVLVMIGLCFVLILCLEAGSIYRTLAAERVEADVVYSYLNSSLRCAALESCHLEEGDILLRRHVTQRTWAVDAFLSPFFTHAAYYAGDTIVESGGWRERTADEIMELSLSESDWVQEGAELIVIVRPRYPRGAAPMSASMREIAHDDRYSFGYSQANRFRFSCAELVYLHLTDYFPLDYSRRFILPDTLFTLATKFRQNFLIVGYITPNEGQGH